MLYLYACFKYVRARTAVTPAHRQFLIFCTTLFLSIHQPHTLDNVQYLSEGDVRNVTCFQEMMAQGAQIFPMLPVPHNHKERERRCKWLCITPGTIYWPQFQ
jgi:hypothetical protein